MAKTIQRNNLAPVWDVITQLIENPLEEHTISASNYDRLVSTGIYQPLSKQEQGIVEKCELHYMENLVEHLELAYMTTIHERKQKENKLARVMNFTLKANKSRTEIRNEIEEKKKEQDHLKKKYETYYLLNKKRKEIKNWGNRLIICNNHLGLISNEIKTYYKFGGKSDCTADEANVSILTEKDFEDIKTYINDEKGTPSFTINMQILLKEIENKKKEKDTIAEKVVLDEKIGINDVQYNYQGILSPIGKQNKVQCTRFSGSIGDILSFNLKSAFFYIPGIYLTGKIKYNETFTINPVKKPEYLLNKATVEKFNIELEHAKELADTLNI